MSMQQPPMSNAGLEALADLSFTRFLTISTVKVIYVLSIVGLALGWLAFVIAGFSQGRLIGGIVAMIVGTLLAALYLLIIRVSLELVVVIFRIGENTARLTSQNAPTGGFPVGPVPGSTLTPGL